MNEELSIESIDTYNNLPDVMPRLLLLSIPLVAGALYGAQLLSLFKIGPKDPRELTAERAIYVVYLTVFIAMWGLYFLSRWAKEGSFFRVRTLRRLLLGTTEDWKVLIEGHLSRNADEVRLDDAKLKEIEVNFRGKSGSSTQNLGMLITAAALELSQIGSASHLHTDVLDTPWSRLTLGLGATAAITSLVCFIIAADSLDSLFNQFRSTKDRPMLLRYFYIQSVNPRYFGLMSLLVAASLIVADISPCIGAVSVAIIASTGYPHWFPSRLGPAGYIQPPPAWRRVVVTLSLTVCPLVLPWYVEFNFPAAMATLLGP
jgi:hypothetical protein